MTNYQLFFDLIKVSLGSSTCLSHTPSAEEWMSLYKIAEKQSLLGICFAGIERLQKQEQIPPLDLLMDWLGLAEYIKRRNGQVNRQCRELQMQLEKDGLSACVMKGQGVAQIYDAHLRDLRQSGDIDVWIKGGYDVVCDYVQTTHPNIELAYHRFHYNFFQDTEVELHQHPSLMNNPFHNNILQNWANNFGIETFVTLKDLGFKTPSTEFNKVFLLCHLYRHFVAEGVGMRQLMDYYFVLKNSSINENARAMQIIEKLGMKRFTSAVMWILKEKFQLDEKNLLCSANEKEGQYLLNEVMIGGNFGQMDERYGHHGRFAMQIQNIRHSTHLILHYPSEVLWSPFWLVWHFFWKKRKTYQIKHNPSYKKI